MLRNTSESLAGRVVFLEPGGLSMEEASPAAMDDLWLRGGFPRAFLAPKNATSRSWREAFIRPYLERDFLRVRGAQRLGFEVKPTRSPKVTASMRTAQQALALDHLYVLCHAPEQATP